MKCEKSTTFYIPAVQVEIMEDPAFGEGSYPSLVPVWRFQRKTDDRQPPPMLPADLTYSGSLGWNEWAAYRTVADCEAKIADMLSQYQGPEDGTPPRYAVMPVVARPFETARIHVEVVEPQE